MTSAIETAEETHTFYLDEGTHLLAGLVLGLINYVQFMYPPAYKEAVLAQFPEVFGHADELVKYLKEFTFLDAIELGDDAVYTLYICYDLTGRLFVSSLYDEVMADLTKENTIHPPEVMRRIYQHSLSNIQPFLVATEMYAKKLGKLPLLGSIKSRLAKLPELA